MGLFASPDALLQPSYMARAAVDEGVKIEPAWKVRGGGGDGLGLVVLIVGREEG